MKTSRRAFSGALLLSAAAFSLRPRAGLARSIHTRGLTLTVTPVLADGELLVSLSIHNDGASRSAIAPEGALAIVLRQGDEEHTVEGRFPARVFSQQERMSRAGPRPNRLLLPQNDTASLSQLTAPWPRELSKKTPTVAAVTLTLRAGREEVTLTGEGTVTQRAG